MQTSGQPDGRAFMSRYHKEIEELRAARWRSECATCARRTGWSLEILLSYRNRGRLRQPRSAADFPSPPPSAAVSGTVGRAWARRSWVSPLRHGTWFPPRRAEPRAKTGTRLVVGVDVRDRGRRVQAARSRRRMRLPEYRGRGVHPRGEAGVGSLGSLLGPRMNRAGWGDTRTGGVAVISRAPSRAESPPAFALRASSRLSISEVEDRAEARRA